MQWGSGRAQSYTTFDRRQPTPLASSSSPAPNLYPVAGPSRSSSVTVPSPKTGPRFRTALHPEHHVDRELRQKLSQSRIRLLSSFEAIAEKFGSVPPEEDDEIDLFGYNISKDRGHILDLEPRPFAEGTDYLGEAIEDDQEGIRLDLLRLQSEPVRGPEQVDFGDDEDELGDWGDKSGLDAQYPVAEIENDWTAEDVHDLDDFLRAEAARRERYGEEPLPVSERPSIASSPLRNLSHLVLDTSPEVEDSVMDEPELSKGSRVKSEGREAHFRRRSSTPPPITHHRETGSSPRRRARPRHSDSRVLELSRSTPNLRGAYSSSGRHLPRELSRTISGLSRNASGHIVQYEEVTTRVVTVQGQAQAPRLRKGKERALLPPPSWERDRHPVEPVRRPSSRSSAHPGSGGPSSARSVQEVTTVRRRETWVSPPSSGRQASGDKRPSHRQQYPPPLWPSPPALPSQLTPSSSSAPPSSPLTRKRIRRRESGPHLPQRQHRSQDSLLHAAPNPRIVPVEEDSRDINPTAVEPARTPLQRPPREPASLLTPPPPEGTPGYYRDLSPRNGTPRACKACSQSSGDRVRLAVYCRGRGRPHLCPYYTEGFDTAAAALAVAKEFSLRSAEATPRSRVETPQDLPPPPPRNEPGYMPTLREVNGVARCCRACKDAGGKRGEWAAYCRGRYRRHFCAYFTSEAADAVPEASGWEAPLQPPDLTEERPASTSPRTPLPPKNHPGYVQYVTMIKGSVRRCRACKDAGGERAALAGFCRGQHRPRLCAHYETSDVVEGEPKADPLVPVVDEPIADPLVPVDDEKQADPLVPPKDHPGYVQTLIVINGIVRRCRACKDAGGERTALAGYCRGRYRPWFCAHYETSDVADDKPEADRLVPVDDEPIADRLVPVDGEQKADPLVPPKDHPGYYQYLVETKGTVRCCRACKSAGGDRAALASYCRGRVRRALCAHFDSDGPQAFHEATSVDEGMAQPVMRVSLASFSSIPPSSPIRASPHGVVSFEDERITADEPEEPPNPLFGTTRRYVLSPDSSESDSQSSGSDDSDEDRFSAYNSSAAEDDADDDRLDDEDEDGNASEDEVQSAPSETDSETSVLSTGYGDAQLLVDITPGAEANYSLPPTDDRFSTRLVFRDVDGVYDLVKCARCVEAGGEHEEGAMWCPGRDAGDACLLAHNAAPNSRSRRAPSSRVEALDDLFTPPPSDPARLPDDRHEPQDDVMDMDMDKGMGGYSFDKDERDDDTSEQDAEIRAQPTRPKSAPSASPTVKSSPTSSVSGSAKSSPPTAMTVHSLARPAPAKVPASSGTSHAELDVRARDAGVILGPPPNGRLSSSMVNHLNGVLKSIPTLASSVSRASYKLQPPVAKARDSGLMLPPPLPRAAAPAPARAPTAPRTTPPAPTIPRAPQTTPRKRYRDPDSDSEPETLPATAPRARASSVSSWEPPSSTPRKKTRMERRAEREASLLEGDDFEWGLDLEAGVEVARTFREGSILLPVNERRRSGGGA